MSRNSEKIIKEFDASFMEEHQKEIKKLSEEEQKVLNYIIYNRYYHNYKIEYEIEIKKEYIKKLSDFVRKHYGKVVDLLVPEEFIDDFYYMTDNFLKYQYSESYYRRSFRCSDYYPFTDKIFNLIYSYYLLRIMGCQKSEMKEFVLNHYDEDKAGIKSHIPYTYETYLITARIDAGDKEVIDIIKEMMTSENNTAILTVIIIRAIICSSNAELHDLLCQLLVAARLSEGLRQAICENADCGTAKAFIKIAGTIKENNLVRFSSVKRAIATWTGLCRYEDPDRLAGKILDDILYVLESRENALQYIDTTDAVHIYMGLWGLGFYEVYDAVNVIKSLFGLPDVQQNPSLFNKFCHIFKKDEWGKVSENKIQLLTVGYFCEELEMPDVMNQVSAAVLEAYPEDYQLFSMYIHFYLYDRFDTKGLSKDSIALYQNKNTAEKHYAILRNMYDTLPKKAITYEKILFPWHSSYISKSELLVCMLAAAEVLDDDEKIDFISGRLSEINTDNRRDALEEIGKIHRTSVQRSAVLNAVADKESYTRDHAVEILLKWELSDEEYLHLESFARYKKADLREGIIKLLQKRDNQGLNLSISRMLKEKDENIRLAALDLLKYALTERKAENFAETKEQLALIQEPTEREEILIQELINSSDSQTVSAENGYGIYDPTVQFIPYDFEPDINIAREYFSVSGEDLTEMHLALLKLIDENSESEYKDADGNEHLLGELSSSFSYYNRKDSADKKFYELVPFHELWAKFYRETVKTPQRFWSMFLERKNSCDDKLTKTSQKIFRKNQKMIFGELSEYHYQKELVEKDERFGHYSFSNMRSTIFDCIISEFELSIPTEIALHVMAYIAKKMPEEELWLEREVDKNRYWGDKKYNYLRSGMVSYLLTELKSRINMNFEENFKILHELSAKNRAFRHYENGDIYSEYGLDYANLSILYYLKAYRQKLVSEDIIYQTLFELFGLKKTVIELNPFISRQVRWQKDFFNEFLKEENKEIDENNMIPADSELYQIGNKIASKIFDKLLDVELKRGDSETIFSKGIVTISRIYGMDRLIEILKAFGNDNFNRNTYYYGNISKNTALSHLLSVCYPTADDSAEKLKTYLSKSKIKEDRLIEVAMFAPQWIDIIEQYLKIEGLKSGCYYFMAHTAESISDQKQAIIAKYTPFTREELNGGCFDVHWFKEAYEVLGEQLFNKLYKSAKYISSGNMHTRARKYADAALGKINIQETEKLIEDKRNKDLLMSLAIIPSENKSDILERYEFIQKFLKESKQFGSQRRASESAAAQYALKNLAVTAGYSDETRLTLSMETQLVKNNLNYFTWNDIGEYQVKIKINSDGKASLVFEKNHKELKSAPAAIKKEEKFLEIKAFCDKLKNQYSRTVRMFELAMEERDEFTFGELSMLCENPVTKVIVENLVFVSSCGEFIHGMISGNKLYDYSGKEYNLEENFHLRVAHPYDLYAHQVWADYQKLYFEKGEKEGLKQPFRQVFRELYTKLSEELDKKKSLLFSGNQIQTRRTIGALRNRRWVADYEDGLQKIYYKDNIIAEIYAVADWFSPSDIEAPTLEAVTFVNRRTYEPIKIADLPDIVYSEVMRDVDLAVSVAHAGGVDPETSHSTVEMRKVILEFNLKLFGIKNVRFEKNHAIIEGTHAKYSIHLGSGVIHQFGGHQINVLAVSGGKKSKLFLPFIDEDPKTAEIMTKVITFAEDHKIKDPYIMEQIK